MASDKQQLILECGEKGQEKAPANMFGVTYPKSRFLQLFILLVALISTVESFFNIQECTSAGVRGRKKMLDFAYAFVILLIKVYTTKQLLIRKSESFHKIGKLLNGLEQEKCINIRDPSGKKNWLSGLSRYPIFWILMTFNLTLAIVKYICTHKISPPEEFEGIEQQISHYVQFGMSVASTFHLTLFLDAVLLIIVKLFLVIKECVSEMEATMKVEDKDDQGEKNNLQIQREPVFRKYRNLRKVFEDVNKILDDPLVLVHATFVLSLVYAVAYMIGKQSLPMIVVISAMYFLVTALLVYHVVGEIAKLNLVIRGWLRWWAEDTGEQIKVDDGVYHISMLLDEARSESLELGKKYFRITLTLCVWVCVIAAFLTEENNGKLSK